MSQLTDDFICYEVFVRSPNALDYKHSSSLHALDDRHALMLARDCYTRRGEAKSLWVIARVNLQQQDLKEKDINQQNTNPNDINKEDVNSKDISANVLYELFVQFKPGLDHRHVASLFGNSPEHVLQQAQLLVGELHLGALWVCKSCHIVPLPFEDRAYFFESARDKSYRLSTFYKLPDAVDHM